MDIIQVCAPTCDGNAVNLKKITKEHEMSSVQGDFNVKVVKAEFCHDNKKDVTNPLYRIHPKNYTYVIHRRKIEGTL